MINLVLILSILVLQVNVFVSGFASWMTRDFCDRALSAGEIIMNDEVVVSDERHVRVYRDTVELSNNSVYIPLERLLVELSDPAGQYVFESLAATFEGGGCNGHRFSSSTKKAYIVLPAVDSCPEVSIVAGWALGHEQVRISYPFTMTCETEEKTGANSEEESIERDIVVPNSRKVMMERAQILNRQRRRMVPGDQNQMKDSSVDTG